MTATVISALCLSACVCLYLSLSVSVEELESVVGCGECRLVIHEHLRPLWLSGFIVVSYLLDFFS